MGSQAQGCSLRCGRRHRGADYALGPGSRRYQHRTGPDLELLSGKAVRDARSVYRAGAGQEAIDLEVVRRLRSQTGSGLKKAQRKAFRVLQQRIIPDCSTR
jgi:hypothetical protein